MIRNNLSILMSERNAKNNKLSITTGISKNTISSISQNDGKMIQLDTINKLCQALDVNPDSFFSYIPFDFEISVFMDDINLNFKCNEFYELNYFGIHPLSFELFVKQVKLGNQIALFSLSGSSIEYIYHLGSDVPIFVTTSFQDQDENNQFQTLWNKIPVGFQHDIEKMIIKEIEIEFQKKYDKAIGEDYLNEIRGIDQIPERISVRSYDLFDFVDPS